MSPKLLNVLSILLVFACFLSLAWTETEARFYKIGKQKLKRKKFFQVQSIEEAEDVGGNTLEEAVVAESGSQQLPGMVEHWLRKLATIMG